MRQLLKISLFLFLTIKGYAQNSVSVAVNVIPPFSPYIQDYVTQPNKISVIVRNLTGSPQTIKLLASLSSDNGLRVFTTPAYNPPVPLVLQANETKLITVNNYSEFRGLLDPKNIEIQGNSLTKADIQNGVPLPEGSYQICIRAYSVATNQPLSQDEPLGCSPPLNFFYIDPPQLSSPVCDAGELLGMPVQGVSFTWIPPVGISPNQVSYSLRIVELPEGFDADPNVYIDAIAVPFFEQKNLKATSFFYGPNSPLLKSGRKYAWRVQAYDIQKRLLFNNDGKSVACGFVYKKNDVLPIQKLIVAPAQAPKPSGPAIQLILPADLTEIEQGNGKVKFDWQGPADMTNKIYAIRVVQKGYKQDPYQLLKGLNIFAYKETPLTTFENQPNFVPSVGMEYCWQVTTLDKNTKKRIDSSAAACYKIGANKTIVLSTPKNGDKIEMGSPINFSWTGPVGDLKDKYYEIFIAEKNNNEDPAKTLLNPNFPNFYQNLGKATSFLPKDLGYFKAGKSYVWKIQTSKKANEQGGVYKIDESNIGTFDYTMPQNLKAISFIIPKKCGYGINDTLTAGENNDLYLRWQMASKDIKDLNTALQKAYPNKNVSLNDNAFAKNLVYQLDFLTDWGSVIISREIPFDGQNLSAPFFQEIYKKDGKYPFYQFDKNYQPDGIYKVKIRVTLASRAYLTGDQKTWAMGECSFRFKEKNEALAIPKKAPLVTKITGQINFNYPAKTANYPLSKTAISLWYQNSFGFQNLLNKEIAQAETNEKGEFSFELKQFDETVKAIFASKNVFSKDGTEGAFYVKINNAFYDQPDVVKYYQAFGGKKEIDFGQIKVLAKGHSLAVSLVKLFKGAVKEADKKMSGHTIWLLRKIQNNANGGNRRPVVEGMISRDMQNAPLGNALFQDSLTAAKAFFANKNISDLEFIGTAQTVQKDAENAVANFNNLLYKTNANDTYTLWCKTCSENLNAGSQSYFSELPAANVSPYWESGRTEKTTLYFTSPEPPHASLKGRLLYRYADPNDLEKKPLANMKVSLRWTYVLDKAKEQNSGAGSDAYRSVIGSVTNMYTLHQNVLSAGFTPWGNFKYEGDADKDIATATTDENGNFVFDLTFDKPLGEFRGVGTYAFQGTNGEFPFAISGTVYRELRVVVQSPYYCSPNNTIEYISPLKEYDLGELTSQVQSFGMKINVKSDKKPNQPMPDTPLTGIEVRMMRFDAKILSDERPADDGQGLNINYEGLGEIVSKGFTDQNGNISFGRLICYNPQNGGTDHYRTIVGTNDNVGNKAFNERIDDTDIDDYKGKPQEKGYMDVQKLIGKIGVFNNEFLYKVVEYKRTLSAKLPRIQGKVISTATGVGLAGANVVLSIYKTGETQTGKPIQKYSQPTDSDGFFIFNDISPSGDPFITIDGYTVGHQYDSGLFGLYTNAVPNLPSLKNGVQWIAGEIPFSPRNQIDVSIKNEKFAGVRSLVKVGDGLFKETGDDGILQNYAVAPGNQELKVIPISKTYFEESKMLTIAKTPKKSSQSLTVFERNHRILLRTITEDNKPIIGATVEVFGEKSLPSDAKGEIRMQFKNVSADNLYLKVFGPNGQGYLPQTLAFSNQETREYEVLPTIILKKGNQIQVLTVNKATGLPLEFTSVYIDYGGNAGVTEVSTNKLGVVEFAAIKDPNFKYVVVKATKDGYVGASATVLLPAVSPIKIELQPDPYNLKTVWGWPIRLEKAVLNGGKLFVDAEIMVDNDAQNADFSKIDAQQKIRFEAIPFIKKGNNYEPENDNLSLSLLKLKLRYAKTFNTELTAEPTTGNYKNQALNKFLSFKKNPNGKGILAGKVHIIDNSFKYPSSFLKFDDNQSEQFYFNENGNADVAVFGTSQKTNSIYQLTDAQGKSLQFKFLEFNATANAGTGTFIKGPDITLEASINAKIANAQPDELDINIGKLVLHENYIDPSKGSGLSFKLGGKWSVSVDDWSIDPDLTGGIRSSKNVVKTGKLDLPFSNFLLRHNVLIMDKYLMTDLNLAGVAQLKVNSDKDHSLFVFDPKTGTDLAGHWKLSLLPNGANQFAAILPVNFQGKANLPGMENDIKFENISLLDNGEDMLSLGSVNQGVMFNKIIRFTPTMLSSYDKFFSFAGNVDTSIPNLPKNRACEIVYAKDASGNVYPTVRFEKLSFETKAGVKFTASSENQKISEGRLEIVGEMNSTDGQLKGLKSILKNLDPTRAKEEVTALKAKAESLKNQAIGSVSNFVNAINAIEEYQEAKAFYNSVNDISSELKTLDYSQTMDIGAGKKIGNLSARIKSVPGDWGFPKMDGQLQGFANLVPPKINLDSLKNSVAGWADVNGIAMNQLRAAAGGLGMLKANIEGIGAMTTTMAAMRPQSFKQSFAGMSFQFDFPNSRLIGSLALNQEIADGMAVKGAAQIFIDPKGFCFSAAGLVSKINLPDPTDLKVGMLMGYYAEAVPQEVEATVFTFAHKKQLPCSFKNALGGFFLTGERPLPFSGTNVDINFFVAKMYFNVDAYLDAYFYLNLPSAPQFGAGISAEVNVEAGLKSITCTSITGKLHAEAAVNLSIEKNPTWKASVDGYVGAGVFLKLEQGIPNPFASDGCSSGLSFSGNQDFCINFSGNSDAPTKPKVNFSMSKCVKTPVCISTQ